MYGSRGGGVDRRNAKPITIYLRPIHKIDIHTWVTGACAETNRVSNAAPPNGRLGTPQSPSLSSRRRRCCRPLWRPLAQTRIDIIPQFFLESGRSVVVVSLYVIYERLCLLPFSPLSILADLPKWNEMDGFLLYTLANERTNDDGGGAYPHSTGRANERRERDEDKSSAGGAGGWMDGGRMDRSEKFSNVHESDTNTNVHTPYTVSPICDGALTAHQLFYMLQSIRGADHTIIPVRWWWCWCAI